MQVQKSNTLVTQSAIPTKWQPRYVLKRINEEDIQISRETRDMILEQLARGGKFVQIGEYTIMLNAIKGIDPKWGEKNIPPRPTPKVQKDFSERNEDNTFQITETITNLDEIEEWEKFFGGDND